jgi:putative phosphoesterase
MRLGVIADVHADLVALKLALTFLDKQQVDQIVCAGDMVEKGPDGEEALKLLQVKGIPCILGNHDREAIASNSLSEEAIAYLKELPQTLTYTIENKRILIAHGAPWSDFVYIYPTTEKHVFKRISYEANADIVLLGHTHLPLAAQVGQMRIYNPGSVCGTYTSGSRTCGILTLPDSSFSVYHIDPKQPIDIAQVRILH